MSTNPTLLRKIIYSPGYGAGWTSWMEIDQARIAIDWPPLVTAIENHEEITEQHPAVLSLKEEMRNKLGPDNDYFYCGGLRNAAVLVVSGPVQITEYDGNESVISLENMDDWL